MLLSEIFKSAPDIEIEMISCDSRMPMRKALFFCVRGIRYNGHDYIKEAYKNGAIAVVYDEDIKTDLPLIYIKVADSLNSLNMVAATFFGNASNHLENIICGGNYNRSFITYGIKDVISNFHPAGYIGSFGISYNDNDIYSRVPTVGIIENQRLIENMVKDGVLSCSYEMDFSAIEFKRLQAIKHDCFVYTGTDKKSYEYEEHQNEYISSYCNYLNDINKITDIIINADDDYYDYFKDYLNKSYVTYGANDDCDYQYFNIQYSYDETIFTLRTKSDDYLINSPLIGLSGVSILTCIAACLIERGYPADEVVKNLANLQYPEGNYERIENGQNFHILIDKAASLSAIEDVLDFAKSNTDTYHRIIVIFGISLKMDKAFKRGVAELINNYADELILTENDYGDQDLDSLNDSLLNKINLENVLVIENRIDAINLSLDLINSNDFLLILGKGNEKYLLRSLGKEFYIGDKECIIKALNSRKEDYDELR